MSRLHAASVQLKLFSLVDALRDWSTNGPRSMCKRLSDFSDELIDNGDGDHDPSGLSTVALDEDAYDDLEDLVPFDADVEVKQEIDDDVEENNYLPESKDAKGEPNWRRFEPCPQCGAVLRKTNLARHLREHCLIQRYISQIKL